MQNSTSLLSLHKSINRCLPFAAAAAALTIGLYGACRLLFFRLLPGAHQKPKLVLKDKTVLIVGASSGIGRALAFEFFAHGSKVILASRSIDKLEALCKELEEQQEQNEGEKKKKKRGSNSRNAHKPAFRYLDVAELENGKTEGEGGEEAALAQIRELASLSIDAKTIDVLVCCAGLSSRGSIASTPVALFRRLMEVNFFGFISITKALLDSIPEDGAIVSINSIQGRVALPYRAPYSCAKHAAQAFFDSLRGEERPNLHVLVVNAGYVNTGFGSRALDAKGKEMGFEDQNQLRGLSPEGAAKRIVRALEKRQSELILAPAHIRLLILLRWMTPSFVWWLLGRKARVDKRNEELMVAQAAAKGKEEEKEAIGRTVADSEKE